LRITLSCSFYGIQLPCLFTTPPDYWEDSFSVVRQVGPESICERSKSSSSSIPPSTAFVHRHILNIDETSDLAQTVRTTLSLPPTDVLARRYRPTAFEAKFYDQLALLLRSTYYPSQSSTPGHRNDTDEPSETSELREVREIVTRQAKDCLFWYDIRGMAPRQTSSKSRQSLAWRTGSKMI